MTIISYAYAVTHKVVYTLTICYYYTILYVTSAAYLLEVAAYVCFSGVPRSEHQALVYILTNLYMCV